MIRHFVTWKLAADDEPGKAAAAARITELLTALVPVIPEITELSVHTNVAAFDVNWDVVLIADYESVADLEAYQVHPAHQAAAAEVRALVAQRASVDITL
jgi:quinol monooxygenase YgiN